MISDIYGKDTWQHLADSNNPIVMYGTGNGADKILAVCKNRGIEISDFFASDGFVRERLFHGKSVLSYSDIKKKYNDFTVVVSFASALPEVMANIYEIDSEHELYVPDVPVFGNTLFDMSFFEKHKTDFEKVYFLLADDESKSVYENVIKAKLFGKVEFMKASESPKNAVFKEILNTEKYRTYADIGAYNGDTIKELLSIAPNINEVYAVEPDPRNFRKLKEYANSVTECKIHCLDVAAWDKETKLTFDGSGNRNSNISGAEASKRKITINATTIDSIFNGSSADFIKYDVEGADIEALNGSENTIKKYSPDLMLSLYHRSEDIYTLPLRLAEIQPEYKLYLRRFPYIPTWDLCMVAKR